MRLIQRRSAHRPSGEPRTILKDEVLKLGSRIVGEGASYLGYGVMEAYDNEKKGLKKGQLSQSCLEAPFEFTIELRTRALGDLERELLLDALRAIGLLGGLGAKSRKGYGSLVLQAMSVEGKPCWSRPASAEALSGAIAKLLPAASTLPSLPPYTALSSRTRVVLLSGRGQQQPLELLNTIGREMMRYRSWGYRGSVLGEPTEGNFRDDHDLMKANPNQRQTHPRRIVFGLPHNYGKRQHEQVGPSDTKDGNRRASPLLVHIHECGESPIAVLSFLPATFLSQGNAATINVGGARVKIAPDPALWQPIERFLARLLDAKARKEPFDRALEVWP
jgi:CRISPR-associated protein Cmr1